MESDPASEKTKVVSLPQYFPQDVCFSSHPTQRRTSNSDPSQASVKLLCVEGSIYSAQISLNNSGFEHSEPNDPAHLLERALTGIILCRINSFTNLNVMAVEKSAIMVNDATVNSWLAHPVKEGAYVPRTSLSDKQLAILKGNPQVRGILRWLNKMFGK